MSRSALALALVLAGSATCGAAPAVAAETWGYEPAHEETLELIDRVEGAAELVGEIGAEAACARFREPDGPWLEGETYVFVLDLEGNTLCHPGRPGLEGRATLEMRDPHGKPVVRSMLRELEGDSHDGWVHYLWPKPDEPFTFYWKTAFVHRAVEPGGRVLVVGSGVYQMEMERFFVVEQVEDAIEELRRHGKAAIDRLRDRAGEYRFYDAYVFVLDDQGKTLVNAGFPELDGVDVGDLRDASGREFVREMLTELEHRDAAWVDYLWPRPGDERPSRKSSFVRRLELDGQTLIVGAGVYLE